MSRASARSRARERRIRERTNEARRVALVNVLAGDDADLRAELESMTLAEVIVWKNINRRPTLPGV